ncbi:MAG: hypothetical protein AAGG38_04720 [Planctomycetota bacterium]
MRIALSPLLFGSLRKPSGLGKGALVWAVAIAGTWGVSAAAQLPANNGGGRALDANNGVGSGGTNRIENQIDFQARNDFVTGNVAGGVGFQDDVGFLAPGVFTGGLGSDDLFVFRAESLRSSPVFANIPTGQSFNRIQGGDVVVFNSATTLPGNRNFTGTPTRFAPEGGVFRVNPVPNQSDNYQITLNQRPQRALSNRFDPVSRGNTLGVLRIEDGSALAVTADPLTGLRRRALPNPAFTPPRATPTPRVPGRPALDDRRVPNTPLDPEAGETEIDPTATSGYLTPRQPGRLTLPEQGPGDANRPFRDDRFADPSGRVRPTLQLGQLDVNPANANFATIERRVQALQQSIFGPTSAPGTNPAAGSAPGATAGSTAPGSAESSADEPPQNAYTQLLDRIREQARSKVSEDAAAAERDGVDTRPAWMRALQEPSADQVRDAENSLESTLERIRRGARENNPREGSGGETGGEADTSALDEAGQSARTAVDGLMENLSYNVRLETLVAEREGRLNELFQQAEDQLAAGQFLNAERTYRQIRLEAPGNPLGQAGLIHTQIGAGMVRSATFNLRALFEQHPELIATRYGENLLPPAERLEWLQQELQRMINADSNALAPGIMLAYLGHQVESRQLVRYGLAIAEDAAPRDPLIPVLRRIWLEQKPTAEAQE